MSCARMFRKTSSSSSSSRPGRHQAGLADHLRSKRLHMVEKAEAVRVNRFRADPATAGGLSRCCGLKMSGPASTSPHRFEVSLKSGVRT